MAVEKVNAARFAELMAGNKPVLLDFYADWCGPCRLLAPLIEEIAAEADGFLVGKVNVDKAPRLAEEFSVMSIPTLIVLKDGKVAGRVVGARPKEAILALLR